MVEAILTPLNLFFIALILLSVFLLRKEPAGTVATIATSIGILGTFIGVLIGLVDFNENDISGSVPKLLAGLKVAFVSSIAGIMVSVLVKGGSKYFGKKSLSAEERQWASIINDMAYSLREMNTGLTGANENSLVSQVKMLRQENAYQLNQLNTTLEAFSEKMVADSTHSIIQALESIIQDFNAKINEQFGENFKHLNEGIGKMLEWQQAYHHQITQMTEQYQLAIVSIEECRKSVQSISNNTAVYHNSAEKLDYLLVNLSISLKNIEALSEGAKEAFPLIERKINELTTHFSDALEVAVRENNRMIETQREAIDKQVSTLQESYEDVKQQQHNLITELNNSYIKAMSERYDATSQQMTNLDKELGEELNKALESMGSQLTSLSMKFVEDYEPLTDKLRELVQSSKKVNNGVS